MERHIAEHGIERNENSKENGVLRVGENDYNANGDERYDIFEELPANEGKFQNGPNLRCKCLVLVDKSSWANINVVKSCGWSTI